MKRSKITHKILLSLLASVPASFLAIAPAFFVSHAHAQYAQAVGKAKAAEIAKKRFGSKKVEVLSVDEITRDGKTFYRVKVLIDGGRVKSVDIDSSNGNIS